MRERWVFRIERHKHLQWPLKYRVTVYRPDVQETPRIEDTVTYKGAWRVVKRYRKQLDEMDTRPYTMAEGVL